MNTLNVKRFGFAVGAIFGLVYLGCVLVLLLAGRDAGRMFANSVANGSSTPHLVEISAIRKKES